MPGARVKTTWQQPTVVSFEDGTCVLNYYFVLWQGEIKLIRKNETTSACIALQFNNIYTINKKNCLDNFWKNCLDNSS